MEAVNLELDPSEEVGAIIQAGIKEEITRRHPNIEERVPGWRQRWRVHPCTRTIELLSDGPDARVRMKVGTKNKDAGGRDFKGRMREVRG